MVRRIVYIIVYVQLRLILVGCAVQHCCIKLLASTTLCKKLHQHFVLECFLSTFRLHITCVLSRIIFLYSNLGLTIYERYPIKLFMETLTYELITPGNPRTFLYDREWMRIVSLVSALFLLNNGNGSETTAMHLLLGLAQRGSLFVIRNRKFL